MRVRSFYLNVIFENNMYIIFLCLQAIPNIILSNLINCQIKLKLKLINFLLSWAFSAS